MPVKSAAQRRFMGAVASGEITKPGLSPAKAKEFLDATPRGAKLPEHVAKKPKKTKVHVAKPLKPQKAY